MNSSNWTSPLFLFFIPCILSSSVTALLMSSNSQQCMDLLELKKGFVFINDGSSLPSWHAGTDCCHWEGVVCDNVSSLIISLDLSDQYISGSVSAALFNLTSLRRLNLANNEFEKSILPHWEYRKLENLTHLNLSFSGVVDQDSMGISHLKKLVSLDLSWGWNEVAPTLELRRLIGGLTKLKELNLNGASLFKNGTEWCGAISESSPQLQVLSLVSCQLSGPIDWSLSKLRNLSVLDLSRNNLSSVVPEFFENFSSLNVLNLHGCELHGLFPKHVFLLKNLKVLDLASNPMLSGNLPEFPEESVLQSLVLSFTNFSGVLPASLGNLKSLSELHLAVCHFSGPIPFSINLSQLVNLDLSLNGFTGEIPLVVGGDKISKIVLAGNYLTGRIPNTFSHAHHLKWLDLGNNSFYGSIPTSLFTLPSLLVLRLGNNNFSGHLDEFTNATSSLSIVDLSRNNLQGDIPKSMFDLAGLTYLGLGSNNFRGLSEMQLFGYLKNLSYLDLSNMDLSVMLRRTKDSSLLFPSLTELVCVSCNLTTIPAFLKQKKTMRTLDLSNNRIAGVIPKWIWSIGSLYLNLSSNSFVDVEQPLSDLSMTPLIVLDLHSNMLQGQFPFPLDLSDNFNLSYLQLTNFFSLSNNRFTGEIPSSICSATYLRHLDLSNNKFNGSIPACIMERLTNLQVLNVRGNHLQGIIPQNISSQCALQSINLHGNELEGVLPRSVSNCDELQVLDVGKNKLVDSFPYWLGNLPTLKVLVLRENGFCGSLLHNLNFTMLQIFDISSNNFTGSLPSECFKNMKAMIIHQDQTGAIGFQYLMFASTYYQDVVTVTMKGSEMKLVKIWTTFTSIDLSNNRFTGDIPEVIGNLKALLVLNMSLNGFTGQIPKVLGNLRGLESLDLSRNQLSGEIPNSLTSLTFLSFLDLSYNNLIGRIPQGNQFSTFSNSSFQENPGLCGSPLSKECVNPTSTAPSSEFIDNSTEFDMEALWNWMFRGLGFGVGFASIIGFQLCFPRWIIFFLQRSRSLGKQKQTELLKHNTNNRRGARTTKQSHLGHKSPQAIWACQDP